MRERILHHLKALVACDTRNPPRDADGISALFAYVRKNLPRDFVVDVEDLGDGCRWLYARRGDDDGPGHRVPLVNVHVDTVPLDSGWTGNPHELVVDDQKATGLGACDIKGALACWLAAIPDSDEHTYPGRATPAALLLTSDEEAGSSLCVRTFLERHDVRRRPVLVAEPTRGQAVLAHRGIGTATLTFHGVAGHASQKRAIEDSAITRCVRFCSRALEHAQVTDNAIRLNLGRIDGGTKANMIASSCLLRIGVRPEAVYDASEVLDAIFALADPTTKQQRGFLAPALPARRPDRTVDEARARALEKALSLGLTAGDDVDFFTEAAFFSAAGADVMVFGPGDIAQAHTAGEWVALEQLDLVAQSYRRILSGVRL
ncbi:MAG: acetylornithine deacetylase [Deltaproteobacteria bacterium]|nr:acetylornithine deacetylase [Deltaproteobacteria bacterium]